MGSSMNLAARYHFAYFAILYFRLQYPAWLLSENGENDNSHAIFDDGLSL